MSHCNTACIFWISWDLQHSNGCIYRYCVARRRNVSAALQLCSYIIMCRCPYHHMKTAMMTGCGTFCQASLTGSKPGRQARGQGRGETDKTDTTRQATMSRATQKKGGRWRGTVSAAAQSAPLLTEPEQQTMRSHPSRCR